MNRLCAFRRKLNALNLLYVSSISGGNIPFDPSTSQICYSDGDCSDAQRLNMTVSLLFVLSALYKLLPLYI